MGAVIASSLVLSSVPCFSVLAEGPENFKYSNDFSTYDAPGTDSTGAWDMEGIGHWVTVKTSETNDVDQWSQDTTVLGPSGEADGVLKLGDNARATFLFDEPVTSGNVHVGFDILLDTSKQATRSNYLYAYFGFMKSFAGAYKDAVDDAVLVSVTDGSTDFDNALVKSLMMNTGASCANPKYSLGGLGDANYGSTATALTFNEWMRVDVIMEGIGSSSDMKVKYYIDGEKKFEVPSEWKRTLQPFYGFVLQTNGNFNNEFALVDNLVIEHSTTPKVLKLSGESEFIDYGADSVSFTLTDDVDTKLLTPENIVVTKDYGARTLKPNTEYWVENVTSNSFDLVFDGKIEKGIYTVGLTKKVVNSWGITAEEAFKFTVGKLENFVYRQDFSKQDGPSGSNEWDDKSIGQWVTAVTSDTNDVDQWERQDTLGADGKAGVLSLGDNARPTFWFNMPIADGKMHLTYYAKFKSQTKAYPYYYSGFAGAGYTGDITIKNDKVTVATHSDDKLVDTFMVWNMHTATPSIDAGMMGSNQANSSLKVDCDVTKWYRFDVLMDIESDGKVNAKYYIDGVEKWTRSSSSVQAPFYGMIFQTNANFDDGEVLIDDVLIRHSSLDKVGAMDIIRKDKDDNFIELNQKTVSFELSEVVKKSVLSEGITVTNKTTNTAVPFTVETKDEAAPTSELSNGFNLTFENEVPFDKGTKIEIAFSGDVRGVFTGCVPDKYLLRTDWEKEGDVVVPAVESIVFKDAKGRDVTSAPYSSTLTKAVVTFNTTITQDSAEEFISLTGGADYKVLKVENIEVDGENVSRVEVEFPNLLDGNTEYEFLVRPGIQNTELNGSSPVCSKFPEAVTFITQNDAGTAFSDAINVSGKNLSYSATFIKNDNSSQALTIMICGYKTVTVNDEEGNPQTYSYLVDTENYPVTLGSNSRGVFPIQINASDWNKEATTVKTFIVRWPDLSTVEIDDNGFIK